MVRLRITTEEQNIQSVAGDYDEQELTVEAAERESDMKTGADADLFDITVEDGVIKAAQHLKSFITKIFRRCGEDTQKYLIPWGNSHSVATINLIS